MERDLEKWKNIDPAVSLSVPLRIPAEIGLNIVSVSVKVSESSLVFGKVSDVNDLSRV
jgi:hypothetical protein